MNLFKPKSKRHVEFENKHDGYKAIITVKKLDSMGHPIGCIEIKGNGVDLKECKRNDYGYASDPMRLDSFDARSNVVRLGHKLSEKYQMEIDWDSIHELFAPAFNVLFEEYDSHRGFDGDKVAKY